MLKMTEELRQRLGYPIPVAPEEYDGLWKLNPIGDEMDTYINVCFAVKTAKLNDGSKLTFAILLDKYKQYMQQCRIMKTKPQYIVRINSFVLKRKYCETFTSGNPRLSKWTD